jgi:hypothetical protein
MGIVQNHSLETAEGRLAVRKKTTDLSEMLKTFHEAVTKSVTPNELGETAVMHDIVCLEMLEYLRTTWDLELVELK